MIFVIDDQSNSGTSEEMAAIDAFNEKLRSKSLLIQACGLSSYKTGNVIDNRGGVGSETGESLFNSPENYSGFWLIEAENPEIARTLAFEGSLACNRKVELRPLL
jgi:hypothetical protein